MWTVLPLLVFFLCGCGTKPAAPGDPSAPREAAQASTPREVRVAAAADLKFALTELIRLFAQDSPGIKITATFGSSGSFFAQLSNEAPFDVFLSADRDYPRKLIEQGQALPDSEFLYAVGHLVIWVPNESPLPIDRDGLEALTDPGVKKIAIANPKHAPYGRAAAAALRHAGIYDAIESKLVLGDNVAQTAQFVESGAADVGLIALSLAMSPELRKKGHYAEVPPDAYPVLEQGGVVLSWVLNPEEADKFCRFLQTAPAREILNRFGFLLPGE
jgi:molybdate transport system substrate-binding protein